MYTGDYMPTSDPNKYILSSDFATLKNDDNAEVSITFPGSVAVATNAIKSYSADVTVGSTGACLRARVASSKDSTKWFSCPALQLTRTGIESGSPVPYGIFGSLSRIDATTVRVYAVVYNPYAGTLTTESGDETFYFRINTFLSPFA